MLIFLNLVAIMMPIRNFMSHTYLGMYLSVIDRISHFVEFLSFYVRTVRMCHGIDRESHFVEVISWGLAHQLSVGWSNDNRQPQCLSGPIKVQVQVLVRVLYTTYCT